MTIGILGGGQLGYMLALAGYPLGLHFRFLDPSPEAPVGRIAHRVTADYLDEPALEKFAHGLEVVTYEFENVPVNAARFLSERAPVYPPMLALEEARTGNARNAFFKSWEYRRRTLPTSRNAKILTKPSSTSACRQFSKPRAWDTTARGNGSCARARTWRKRGRICRTSP